jgi:hypothetical protein
MLVWSSFYWARSGQEGVSSCFFELDAINEMILNGVRYSFLAAEEKQAMEDAFREEMTRLQQAIEEAR